MLIGKFHKLIESKLLWAVFLVVIVFSFVIWGMRSPGSGKGAKAAGVPGKLDGKNIPPEEFQSAFTHMYAGMILMYGREIPQTREVREQLETGAWDRLAALRLAEKLGIQIGDAEVLSAIHSIPAFQNNGRFSLPHYQAIAIAPLAEIGLGPQFFEQHIRQEIALQRLQELSNASFLVPPADVTQMLSTITDRLTLEVVHLKPNAAAAAKGTDEDLRAFFAENMETYRIPPQVRIRTVQFTANAAAADLPEPSKEDIQDFFEEHQETFWTQPEPGADGKTGSAKRQTLEEARPKILELMRLDASRARAVREAERFADLISPLLTETEPLSFDKAAAAMRVVPTEHGPFSAKDEPGKATVSKAVIRAAFELQADEPVSRAIPDGDNAIVLTVLERLPSRIPDLQEIGNRVSEDAQNEALNKALTQQAMTLQSRAEASGLRAVATTEKLDCIPVEGLSAANAAEKKDLPFSSSALLRGVLSLSAGAVSDPIPDGTNGLLVAQVIQRTPATADEVDAMRPEVEAMLKRERTRQTFQDLHFYLTRPEVFTNMRALQVDETSVDEAELDDEAKVPAGK